MKKINNKKCSFAIVLGYVYMNGDADKLSAGAVYPSSTESSMTTTVIDPQHMQHNQQQHISSELSLSSSAGSVNNINLTTHQSATKFVVVPTQQQQQHQQSHQSQSSQHRTVNSTAEIQETDFVTMNGAMSASSSDGAAETYAESSTSAADGGTVTTADGNAVPLEQLKQMLATQLEYYFSRFVFVNYYNTIL